MSTANVPKLELKTGFDRIFYIAKKVLELGIVHDSLLDDVQTCVRKTHHGYQVTVNFKPWNRSEHLTVSQNYIDNDLFSYATDQSFFNHAERHAEQIVQVILADAYAISGGWRY